MTVKVASFFRRLQWRWFRKVERSIGGCLVLWGCRGFGLCFWWKVRRNAFLVRNMNNTAYETTFSSTSNKQNLTSQLTAQTVSWIQKLTWEYLENQRIFYWYCNEWNFKFHNPLVKAQHGGKLQLWPTLLDQGGVTSSDILPFLFSTFSLSLLIFEVGDTSIAAWSFLEMFHQKGGVLF